MTIFEKAMNWWYDPDTCDKNFLHGDIDNDNDNIDSSSWNEELDHEYSKENDIEIDPFEDIFLLETKMELPLFEIMSSLPVQEILPKGYEEIDDEE